MRVFYGLDEIYAISNPVITTGSFDGVHIGHRTIINRINDLARKCDGESVLITFDPHPRKVLYPQTVGKELRLITTLKEKIELLSRVGLQNLVIIHFTPEFSRMSSVDFIRDILVTSLHAHKVVIGFNHQFGHNREGNFDYLYELGQFYGFGVEEIPEQDIDNETVSSTKIREALQHGEMETANSFLGYPFSLHGTVVEGQKLGRQIQFPTANIAASDPDKIIPGYGVYAVKVRVQDQTYIGMLNIGSRPTVNNNADHRSIEVHLFDFDSDIYGEHMELIFFRKLREEQKFESLDILKAQLFRDKADTIAFFSTFRNTIPE